MERRKKTALTEQAWLHELGRQLVWFFSTVQVKDILSDYREQFDAGRGHDKTDGEIIQALGTPAEAAALLLEEEPAAKANRLRQDLLWGGTLAVCLAFWWVCFASPSIGLFWVGTLFFHPAAMSVLFMLLRGPCRMVLYQRQVSKVLPYHFPAVLTLAGLLEKLILPQYSMHLYRQYRTSQISEEAFQQASRALRYGNTLFWVILMAIAALLAVWLLVRSEKSSVRYFPGVIHSVGALESIFFSFSYFSAMDIDSKWQQLINIPMSLLPYLAGLATAIVFQRWVDGRTPLPRFFQGGAASWQDWRHRLGVSLLGWFPAEQAVEIMADYQEQYELGLEQGKKEESLLSEMGRPETVVRDLLAEDRKARLNRRKTWPWIVAVAVAGWLLVGLLRAFEFGYSGFGWFYSQNVIQISLVALVLGTVSLFFLLRVRERAAVERRFPAPKKPAFWLLLPPLTASTLVESLVLCAICNALDYRTPVFLDRPLTVYIILSIEFSVLLLTLLLIWTLNRCVSGSIRHLPAVPPIAGSIAHVLCAGIYLRGMDTDSLSIGEDIAASVRANLPAVYPLLAGLVLGTVLWGILRAAGKKEG